MSAGRDREPGIRLRWYHLPAVRRLAAEASALRTDLEQLTWLVGEIDKAARPHTRAGAGTAEGSGRVPG